MDHIFYGVLDTDTSREVTRNGNNSIETRIVLRDEQGREFTLVTELNGRNGYFSLTVEGENRSVLAHYDGNVYHLD